MDRNSSTVLANIYSYHNLYIYRVWDTTTVLREYKYILENEFETLR